MKTVVIGGAGFIGSHLAEELVKQGHEVTVFDNFFLGNSENIGSIKDKVKIVKGDIRDAEAVMSVVKGSEIVFNQAAASSSPMFTKNLREAVSVNVDGFINVLEACRQSGAKLVYASTSSVYGNAAGRLREDMKIEPVNFYASTKLMNEHLAVLFSKTYGLETIGFRYMSIYGPNEKPKGEYANMVSQFLWSMENNERPVVYGDGTQTREFTYVKDVVNANILAMESKISGEVFNVGTGKSCSLNDLVEIINKLLGKAIRPKYVDNPFTNYISAQLSDISKIRNTLGYEPGYSLEEGLVDILSNK